MLLLTDLDNTVIFSHRHEVIGKKIWGGNIEWTSSKLCFKQGL